MWFELLSGYVAKAGSTGSQGTSAVLELVMFDEDSAGVENTLAQSIVLLF